MSRSDPPSVRQSPRAKAVRRVAAALGALALVVASGFWWMTARDTSIRVQERAVDVSTGPSGVDSVSLDTTFFLPPGADAAHPVPAVLLAHGFGQTKDDVATSARDLAGRGYAVLAWTAQGFGASGGQIHLVSPDWEVRDAGELVTWLASRPEVRQDGPGDPRVGVVGSSYGGALALLLAGTDRRVDAIVATATWHDLATALLPDRATGDPTRGVFKRQWAARLFGTGSVGSSSDSGASGGGTQCGRFAADVCAAYLDLAATGQVKASTLSLLRRSSPAAVASGIRAPTLLIQGTEDTLFPLAEADANQRAIAATGTPVRVAWFVGGHDGGPGPRADQDRVRRLSIQWLDHYLAGLGQRPADSFTFSRITSFTYARMTRVDTTAEGLVSAAFSVPAYPTGAPRYVTAPLHGPATQVASPPNSAPAAVSTVPGVSAALAGAISGGVAELPGQHADFESPPLAQAVDVVGAPRVDIRVAAPSAREAVLFVKIYDVDEQGRATLPAGLVAPVRVGGLGADITTAVPVTVTLPMLARRFERGHRVRVTIATTDQAYAGPAQPAVYVVATSGPVALPALPADPVVGPAALWWRALLAVLALLGAALIALTIRARRRRRRSDRPVAPEHAGTPLVIQGLRKEYADGFVAVSHVDITVDRDRVVGLLGPNGAGKTTTLRVLLGLTRPTAGTVLVFGHRVAPGAPILSRLGALVEGPGFLSHLSGLTNLELYWRTTGRPAADARLTEVLAIAGLGAAIHRPVRTYSRGMRQRLAVAQAMLGMPDLLVLDEPTDGLDPPQISEMREVLRGYARDGRAVLVSSHLLAEVERICTDVVIVHRGTVAAAGPVAEIVGESRLVQLDVSPVDRAEEALRRIPGVGLVSTAEDGGLLVSLDGLSRADLVAALVGAAVRVDRVVPYRRLEEAFLNLVGGHTTGSGAR